ncbi:MBL fold metallo-hydrolase [Roseateles sp. DAIF2]|uniref:MBL fold metallo-hydrolase n=1 Tax=Roseateles sp. DAIF2 TaxID=2714952 RepID=UPI0018A29BFB|nr:MBL fold metallo-hydrolase [Roseateles sp. DAIF2]QPF75789.1 MBL fold metallo-hydrolase [Roseateles sp. DAIF2]
MSDGSSAAAGLLPPDLRVLERGWLSSNSVLMCGDPAGALLVDSGYCSQGEQTAALVREALAGDKLRLIVNTHLHSDHCGGNARLAAEHGCPIWIPPGDYAAVLDWDEERLSYRPTGQRCERFHPVQALLPGQTLGQAGRDWQCLAAAGHDPHSLVFFEPEAGVLISADALWEHGFGIVFPELDGEAGFDEVEATLDLIESLQPGIRCVIPGHGPMFADVGRALGEARSRLAFFRQYPERHTRHAAKALLMFHMLEVGHCSRAELETWLATQATIHQRMWQLHFASQLPLADWTESLLQELAKSGALRLNGATIGCR